MNDEKLEQIESGLTNLIKEVSELVGEFKWYRKEADQIKSDQRQLEERVRKMENAMPSLVEMKENNNKIRNSIFAAILVAAIFGGIIAKFSG